mmetsp:Transcript_23835/g.20792  ORF Transcript_23835/g.20792 Transcript_23835/m.20792 type:complete len:209 (-) Transcript_23835:547-1173(-)
MVPASLANPTCDVIEGINRAISTSLGFFRIVLVSITRTAFSGFNIKDFVTLTSYTTFTGIVKVGVGLEDIRACLTSSRDLCREHNLTDTTFNTFASLIVHVGIILADASVFFLLVVGIFWAADTRRVVNAKIFCDIITENALTISNTIILVAILTGLAASWGSSIVKEGICRAFFASLGVIIKELVLLLTINTSVLIRVKVLIQETTN